MRFDRQAGVFCHLTSLPGPHGIGDLGDGARWFVDRLADADQSLWQFCPLGPTSGAMGDSPYQSYSAFAGNPLLVSLDRLHEAGWLTDDDLDPADVPEFDDARVDYDRVRSFKRERLRRAFERFRREAGDAEREAFSAFREREAGWLSEYALFMALKSARDGEMWTDWPAGLKRRDPDALADARERHADAVDRLAFQQWVFDRQWRALADYAAERGVSLVGDLPIYVALDSADVWASPDAFQLDDANEPVAVAGVPPNPDDDGQRWGNPLYDWDRLAETGYEWWLARLRRLFDLVDVTRVDHFKGFDSYYAIPAEVDDPDAGEWREGPGADFLRAVEAEFGALPFIVEDLGFPDRSLVELMGRFDLPGMRVPQYADWCREGDMHQPMHYPRDCVGYTSTHDTDTVVGYYRDLPARQRDCLQYNLGTDAEAIHWDIIGAVWRSEAVLTFTTPQDLLGLGSDARMNTPGTERGNWSWRLTREALTDEAVTRLGQVTDEAIR
ncbi:MAG: 4-alpha-glucanotransferase [Halolamina sp.]